MKGRQDIDKIIDFALLLGAESDKQIADYDRFNNYIEPLFLDRFGIKYEPSLKSMYQGEKKQFLEEHTNLLKNN